VARRSKARRAPGPWSKLTDREKVERLDRDLAVAESRIARLERELLEADSRVRVLFGNLGRTRCRLHSLEGVVADDDPQVALEVEHSCS
jgi:predicted  nucleic acid-binding Zn-ribbon protein